MGEKTVRKTDVLIVGGGPAGLAAALRLYENGVKDILIVEREKRLGGILRQCIHDGFGLTRFGESLSGPEYAQRFIDRVNELKIPCLTNAAVVEIKAGGVTDQDGERPAACGADEDGAKRSGGMTDQDGEKPAAGLADEDRTERAAGLTDEEKGKTVSRHRVTLVTREGLLVYEARAVILAMGCRERTRGALAIPGERPAGVFTAGVAQAYINLYNRMPAREVVILGSGDIGMIMARRLTLEGAHVHAVFEIMAYPSGLPRNIQQCLRDFDIPLYLSHTVTKVHGDRRLSGVTVSKVDEKLKPIPGTEKYYPCDTLILSAGLIPENELSLDAGVVLDPRTKGAVVDGGFQTSVKGIFAAGNVLHVHDLVDYVSMEAEELADSVGRYLEENGLPDSPLAIHCGYGIHHTVPQRTDAGRSFTLALRVTKPMKDISIVACQGGAVIGRKKMKKALPAEMIHIELQPSPADGDLEVHVE